jgi:hypothetical protein
MHSSIRASTKPGWRAALVMCLALPFFGPTEARAAERTRIAVMEITATRNFDKGLNTLLNELLLTELSEEWDVVGKSDIASMLGFEQQKQMLGCSDDNASCLAEIGGALGAPYILSGSIGNLGKKHNINLKVLETSKSKVISRHSVIAGETEEQLVADLQKALRTLMEKVPGAASKQKAEAAAKAPASQSAAAAAPAKESSPSVTKDKPAAPSAAAAAAPPVVAKKSASHAASWVGIGVGVAAVGGGIFFGKLARDSATQYGNALQNPIADGSHLAVAEEAKTNYQSQTTIANVLIGTGGVVCATAILYRIFGEKPPAGAGGDAPSFVVAPSTNGLSLSGSF